MGFLKAIDALNERVGKIFSPVLLVMIVLAFSEVVLRYFFSRPTTWVWEINSQLMVLVCALGAGWALRDNSHISVDIVYKRLSRRKRAIVDLITSPFFFLLAGSLVFFGAKEALRAYEVNQRMLSQFASPLWPVKTVIVIGAVLILLQGVVKLIRDLRIVLGREEV